jgi:Protein of unknown function (DUF3631)
MKNRAAEGEEGSRLELLIADVRDIFNKLKLERISSAQLIEELVEIVPRPWAEYGKGGKPITQNKLARLLKPLAIKPQVLRIGEGTPSGYQRHQFQEAWERFLPMEGESNLNTSTNAGGMGTSGQFQTSTSESNVEVGKSQKSNNDGLCLGVEVGKGGAGQEGPPCSYCGRPGGNRVAYDDLELTLHRECEDPWIKATMREEGIS